MRIALVGFMGAGKSTVGPLLADAIGHRFVDADAEIEAREGRPIPAIFEEGEPAFRRIERAVLADLLAEPSGVISLGGGALTQEGLEEALSGWTVVHLNVTLPEALRRVGDGGGRPMLAKGDVSQLYRERLRRYAEVADVAIEVDDLKPDAIAAAIGEVLPDGPEIATVEVGVPRPYPVHVGSGIFERVLETAVHADVESVFVITHAHLRDAAKTVERATAGKRSVHVLEVADGEPAKSLASASSLWERLRDRRAHRRDLVIGVGGGVITDLAGFVAATYGRGMRLMHVPTTLLGQVDAAIGGKNGVNLGGVKNLVGTIYHPDVVVCDTDLLASLPEREFRSGLAEVAKYGLIADKKLLWLLNDPAVKRVSEIVLREMIRRSVGIKAAVVAEDEMDTGRRAVLNYGHTVGHAIESTSEGRFTHGEAISLGMMAAAHLSVLTGLAEDSLVDLHRTALSRAGLPTKERLDPGRLREAMAMDKKYVRGSRFVLLRELEQPKIGCAVDWATVSEAIERLGE